jgi:hypothetical protein
MPPLVNRVHTDSGVRAIPRITLEMRQGGFPPQIVCRSNVFTPFIGLL